MPFATASLPADLVADAAYLIGVSGGRDSMALLHWLHARGFQRLIVCHLDHCLRPSSVSDAEGVRTFAAKLGHEFVARRTDVAALARKKKLSLEAAARDARYAFFARAAQDHDCPRLLLAHHADDQVETFLLQLLRGAGPGGLGGMRPDFTRAVGRVELRIIRPFLAVWRAEIDDYVCREQLPFCEDESNAELLHTRNRLRHVALPALSNAFGRDVDRSLWRAAELLRAEDEWLAQRVDDLPAELSVAQLREAPLALQRRTIHAWLVRGKINGAGFDEVEAVRTLLLASTAKVNLPGGRCARRRAGRIFLDCQ